MLGVIDVGRCSVRVGPRWPCWVSPGRRTCHDPLVSEAAQRPRARGGSIRVAVADDHELFRRGLTMLLTAEDDIEVVGEAGDGIAAIELAASTAPDVMLMDVRMPKRSGIEACRAINEVSPTARIIMLMVSDGGGRPLRPHQERCVPLHSQGLLHRRRRACPAGGG